MSFGMVALLVIEHVEMLCSQGQRAAAPQCAAQGKQEQDIMMSACCSQDVTSPA